MNNPCPGAQTERRGEAWAGERLTWRQNLTGRFLSVVHGPPAQSARRL
jgi:hypothetical protein